MTKQEHINHWKDTASKDWVAVQNMYKAKDYVHALFFAHLVLEKLAKAIWIKNNTKDTAPRIHHIIYILDAAKIELTETQRAFFEKMNYFQLEGRYPDYKTNIYKLCTKEYTDTILTETKKQRQWLLKKI